MVGPDITERRSSGVWRRYLVVTTLRRRPSVPLNRFAGIAAACSRGPFGRRGCTRRCRSTGCCCRRDSNVRTWWSRLSPSRMGLSPSWAQHIALADETLAGTQPALAGAPPIWSTFAGLVEARHRWLAPDTDYLIHVLGPDQLARYLTSFRDTKPAVVQTARVTSFSFEPAMQVRWWPFYDALLADYDVSAAGPYTLLWTRRLTGTRIIAGASRGTWRVTDDDHPVAVPCSAASAYVLEVEFGYETALPLPVLSSLRRTVLWVSTPTRRRLLCLTRMSDRYGFQCGSRRNSCAESAARASFFRRVDLRSWSFDCGRSTSTGERAAALRRGTPEH